MATTNMHDFWRIAREKKGLSQIDVAKNLGYQTSQFVSNWETGRSKVPKEVLKKIIKMYGLKPKEVLDLISLEMRKELERFVYEER